MSDKKNLLSEYDIAETVYNTGIKNFKESDMKKWLGKDPVDFLEEYVNDINNNIERSENTVELYYKGIEFQGNFKTKPEDIIIADNGNKIGRIEVSGVPLYDKITDKKVGIAHWNCVENNFQGEKYIECKLVYFLDNNFIPESVRKANNNIFSNNNYSTIVTEFNYVSRIGLGTLFAEGDYFLSRGYYSLENGLNKTDAINNIYLPINSPEKRRSIIVYFNKLDSNNFLPQDNYGIESGFFPADDK